MTKLSSDIPGHADTTVGLYIHVPFCERICPYCDFAVVAARTLEPADEERYVAALLVELDSRRADFPGRSLATVYFGGGTPSLLQPRSLARLLDAARAAFSGTTTERERLPAFRELGINRLSMGVQSFDDTTLKKLGRAHKASESRQSLRAARAAGFENLSLDLILACPGQSFASFERDLESALEFEPEHLSVYELTIERGTPFALADERGQLARPSEDLAAQMLEHLASRGAAAGLERYEISNAARPGFESAHNSRYWARLPVLGLGVGAWSSEAQSDEMPFGGRRMNSRDLAAYLEGVEGGDTAVAEIDRLSESAARGEAMFLGLRRTAGLSCAAFETEFGAPPRKFYSRQIDRLMAAGLLAETPCGDLRLTERGVLLSDTVFADFV
ncbi:MAG: radical SAM family heme chaperone HemW [Deltaproteobacteria bacterium]|nr:radical SAM family heme chaperone HemW [Deltaproteobacteria bacterium]